MKKGRGSLLAAALITVFAAGFISSMSVKAVLERGVPGFILGGRAKLRNTMEIPLSEVSRLTMDYTSKNIFVYASQSDMVIIKEYLYSNNPKAMATMSRPDSQEVVITGGQGFIIPFFNFGMEVERVEVYIPENSLEQLSLETKSGNITSETSCVREEGRLLVEAASGNIKWQNAVAKEIFFQAASGNVKLKNLRGNMQIQTGSGNISGKQLQGALQVQAGSGNIALTEVSGEGNMSAGSGNVKVDAEIVTGDMSLSAGSGNVSLELPENLTFCFQGETGSGKIHTDFDETLSFNQKGNHAEGMIGADAPEINIHVKTNSGNVRVLHS